MKTFGLLVIIFSVIGMGPGAKLDQKAIPGGERVSRLRDACERDPYTPWESLTRTERQIALHHILVNEKQNILYCYVPKVACSNWKRVITVLDGNASDTETIKAVNHEGFKRLSSFSAEEIRYRLQNYYKFMFVRNPLDRLVSAYKDKLTGDNGYYFETYVKLMINKFRNKYEDTKAPPPGTKGATITEFFRYLTTTQLAAMDEHWMPYNLLCQPCIFNYDFIGSMENLDEDAEEVLRLMNVNDLVRFPRKQRMYTERAHNPSTAELLSQIPKTMLRSIVHIYRRDFDLFSYEKPQ
ncbi:carbohydrate sulfotransferase 14 isoform X3 [Nematostella vectensis]|uniref:carbohydrate sulfotransferase 14 isoform X3 n=1 Tax=Nematostella vectensis TaxID=45351 RepID=UPI0013901455|nr:carbohydrate sulfotransferase 14 isoform X3 [Nematostella vectensis]